VRAERVEFEARDEISEPCIKRRRSFCMDGISDFIFKASRAYTSLSLIDALAKSLFNLMSYGQHKCSAATAAFRTNFPPGRVVDPAAAGFFGIFRVYHLFDVGGVSGKSLLARNRRRELSLAVLFAGNFRDVPARMVWQTEFLSNVAGVFTGLFCFVGAGRISFHLLLLSRRVLQRILGRPDRVRRRRAAQKISRRKIFPADPAKRPPLFRLPRGSVHHFSFA